MTQLESLKQNLSELGAAKLCIAFSGGVDSALLLKTAVSMGFDVLAVTFQTFLHPHGDLEEAKRTAQEIGAAHRVVELDELTNPMVLDNPPERCYHCKHMLFSQLLELAKAEDCTAVLDGTNADDLKEYRPGLKALAELGIRSPLAECGFTKEQVRAMAAELGMKTASKPSTPCLATRLPYHTRITTEVLRQIEAGEAYLKTFGFYNVRLRVHGTLARIEVDADAISQLMEHREDVVQKLRELGFEQVTVDLAGFRSGSYDERLK